jgi:mannose/fructose/N-acetylgalactosamine-specific phosphotransferase system component IIC
MKSLVKYFIIGFKEIFSNKILIIGLSVVNLFLISGIIYKEINNKKELNKYEDLKS